MVAQSKAALVTGSGQNIGRATALALADEGINVVINGSKDRTACERVCAEAASRGVQAQVVMGDIGTQEGARQVADEALAHFGTIDILVNNAAIRPQIGFLEMTEDDWQRVLDVDLNAGFRLAQACLPGMLARGWGRIINFAGMNAIHGYDGRAAVSVSKHGAWGLTKSLAKEFGKQGVTTNIISPGPIRPDSDQSEHAAHIHSMAARVPVGRLGEPEEVAALVALLVSEKGAFINGQLLQVNGGTET